MAWLPGWDKRIEIKIEDYAGDIGAEVTWFPVTVFLTATQGEEVFAELTTDAEYLKVAFTKADGTTELYAEKELFDVSEELGIFHVSRDGWVISANTSIYMYYDKDHADNTTYIGVVGLAGRDGARENVWNPEYKMVQHQNDETTSTITDSTSNNNDGTKKAANEPIEAVGKVGQGQDFDGTNDYIVVSDSADFDFAGAFTLEAIYSPDITDADKRIMYRYDATATDGYFLGQAPLDDGTWHFQTFVSAAQGDCDSDTTPTGDYEHIVGVRNAAGLMTLYVDGVAQTDTDNNAGAIDATANLHIGCAYTLGGNPADGIIDEIRVSDTDRSAAWIKGTKNTLYDTLFTYGSEVVRVNALFFGANF